MAEIDTADRQERVREQAKAAVTAYRAMLDCFVHNRVRATAPVAEQVHPRQSQDSPLKSTNSQ
jgi:hypothetical protein